MEAEEPVSSDNAISPDYDPAGLDDEAAVPYVLVPLSALQPVPSRRSAADDDAGPACLPFLVDEELESELQS